MKVILIGISVTREELDREQLLLQKFIKENLKEEYERTVRNYFGTRDYVNLSEFRSHPMIVDFIERNLDLFPSKIIQVIPDGKIFTVVMIGELGIEVIHEINRYNWIEATADGGKDWKL